MARLFQTYRYGSKKNDNIDLLLEEEVQSGIVSSNIPLDIIYEDNDLIVLNKSPSITVHPGAGDYKDTLAGLTQN